MMQYFRLIFRTLGISIVSFITFCALAVGRGLFFRSGKGYAVWRGFVTRLWAKSIAKMIGMRITIKGSPPRPPFFLVSNHVSYIDIILLFTQVNAIFVAKGDLENWPIFNFLIKAGDTIFIDRAQRKDVVRVNRLIREAMLKSEGIIIFPEGTSSSGSDILLFKPSLFEYPAKNKLPVSYASIHYRTPECQTPAYLSVCWWGTMALEPHFFDLMKVPGFEATVHFGAEMIPGDNRKLLAQETYRRIKSIFVPIVKDVDTGEPEQFTAPFQRSAESERK